MFYVDKYNNIIFENTNKGTISDMKFDNGSDRTLIGNKYSTTSFILLFIFIGIAILISFTVGMVTKNICLGFFTFLPLLIIVTLIWYFFLSKI